MIETKIKVCGITTVMDAVTCSRLGVDYVGLIFEESPRKISREMAEEIRHAAPSLNLVGVFADQDLDFVTGTSQACGVDMIQLNGNESPEYCRRISDRTMLPIVKTLWPAEDSALPSPADYNTASFFLLDERKKSLSKSGMDSTKKLWEKASLVRRKGYRIFLAGELNPSNVKQAVEKTQPFCVDVCHGVEQASGAVDINALRWFMAETKGCFI